MASIRILLVIICLAFVNRNALPNGNLLDRLKLIKIAQGELGVREATGNNDGARVEEYLASVRLKKGDPWCAAYISWVFKRVGYPSPRTGWSPALFPGKKLVPQPAAGDVYGIYFNDLKRIAHCGLIERHHGSWIYGIEGNTNRNGSREGNGVYRKVRHFRTIKCFADWAGGR